MDLSKYSTAQMNPQGVPMTLRDPISDAPLVDEATKEPVVIYLVGSDSQEFTSRMHATMDKRLNNGVLKGKTKVRSEELKADSVEIAIACTKGWKHISYGGDPEFQPNEVNIRKLYTECPWIKEQVDEFISERKNFLGN